MPPCSLPMDVVEGCKINVLADSGSQVNTVMPGYVCQHEFPVLPLGGLVDHPLNLTGLGGMRTRPLGFVILRVQVSKIAGYDEDIIFLVVPDESEFSRHIPLVIGTCKLARIINVIKKSELDRLSTPWQWCGPHACCASEAQQIGSQRMQVALPVKEELPHPRLHRARR